MSVLNFGIVNTLNYQGYPSLVMISDGGLASIYKLIVVKKSNFIITITQGTESKFLDQILSTFKFIATSTPINNQ
jgi:hypothetical protein